MTNSRTTTFQALTLAIVLNIALGLSGVSVASKVSPKDISIFSTKVMANFGITQEVDSNTRVAPLDGIYRAEATPGKIKFEEDAASSNKRKIEVSNIFVNYSKTFQIFSKGVNSF